MNFQASDTPEDGSRGLLEFTLCPSGQQHLAKIGRKLKFATKCRASAHDTIKFGSRSRTIEFCSCLQDKPEDDAEAAEAAEVEEEADKTEKQDTSDINSLEYFTLEEVIVLHPFRFS